MTKYQELQRKENEVMNFWENLIEQCKLKAFIQSRDSVLYLKLENLLNESEVKNDSSK